jgi:hypothetical protein
VVDDGCADVRRLAAVLRDGVYVVERGRGTLERIAAEQDVDHLFLKMLRRLTAQGRNVTDKKGTSYAPAIFADQPEIKEAKVSKQALAEAMNRLFEGKKLEVVTEGPPSKQRTKIVETCCVEETPSINPSTTRSTNSHQPSTNVPPLPPIPPPHDGGRWKGLGGNGPHLPPSEGVAGEDEPEMWS